MSQPHCQPHCHRHSQLSRRFRPIRNSAFTLIEMMVALLLGTILLVAIGSVLRRVFSDWQSIRQESSQGMGLLELREQISRDLTNARRVRISENRIELEGFLYRDPNTMSPTQRLATVVYEIRKWGAVSILVRVQSVRGVGPVAIFQKPSIEMMHVGADRMLAVSDRFETATDRTDVLPKAPGAIKLQVYGRRGEVLISLHHLRLGNPS